MKVNMNSMSFWLYRFQKFMANPEDYVVFDADHLKYELPTLDKLVRRNKQPRDFCQYTRAIFIFLPLQIIGALLIWAFPIGALLFYATFIFSNATASIAMVSVIGVFAVAIALTFFVGYLMDRNAERQINSPKVEKEDSFVKKAYRSWKDNYCPMIELEETK